MEYMPGAESLKANINKKFVFFHSFVTPIGSFQFGYSFVTLNVVLPILEKALDIEHSSNSYVLLLKISFFGWSSATMPFGATFGTVCFLFLLVFKNLIFRRTKERRL